MNSRYKKIIYRTINLIIITFVLAHLVPIPINRELKAIEIKLDDPDYLLDCTIHISGRYYINLFTDDSFKGQISISTYPFTSYKMRKVSFDEDGDELMYIVNDAEHIIDQERYHFGRIHSGLVFDRMVIKVWDENALNKTEYPERSRNGGAWSTIDGFCIVPTDSREKAIKILKWHDLIPADY